MLWVGKKKTQAPPHWFCVTPSRQGHSARPTHRAAAPSPLAPVTSGPLASPSTDALDLSVRKKEVLKGQGEVDPVQSHDPRLTRQKRMHILWKKKKKKVLHFFFSVICPLLNIVALIARDLFYLLLNHLFVL